MVLAAAYLLTFFQKVFLGKYAGDAEADHGHDAVAHGAVAPSAVAHGALLDLNWREIAVCVPMIVMCFVIGLYATPFFTVMATSVESLLRTSGLAVLQ